MPPAVASEGRPVRWGLRPGSCSHNLMRKSHAINDFRQSTEHGSRVRAVSTVKQDLDRQIEAPVAAAERIYLDKKSGATVDPPDHAR